MLIVKGFDIETVEGATEYLKNENFDIGELLIHKAINLADDNNSLPKDYCKFCRQTSCKRLNFIHPLEEFD